MSHINRALVLGYGLGALVIVLALYLLLHPYETTVYFNATLRDHVNVTVRPHDYVLVTVRNPSLNPSRVIINSYITLLPGSAIQYNITLNPGAEYKVNLTDTYMLNLYGNDLSIIVVGLHRPPLNYLLTLTMVIAFIFTVTLVIIGSLQEIKRRLGKN